MAHQISKTNNVQNDKGKMKQILEKNSTDTDTKIETVKLKV